MTVFRAKRNQSVTPVFPNKSERDSREFHDCPASRETAGKIRKGSAPPQDQRLLRRFHRFVQISRDLFGLTRLGAASPVTIKVWQGVSIQVEFLTSIECVLIDGLASTRAESSSKDFSSIFRKRLTNGVRSCIFVAATICLGNSLAHSLAAFTVGIASFIALLEGLKLLTGRAVYGRISTFSIKIFAIAFGMRAWSQAS